MTNLNRIRKIASVALIIIGMTFFVYATTILISKYLSLPAWSLQTEGKWVGFGLHLWGYLAGELPLSLGVTLTGILLYPKHSNPKVTKILGIFSLIIALISLAGLVFNTYNLFGAELDPSYIALLGVAMMVVPLLVITILAGYIAMRNLSIKI